MDHHFVPQLHLRMFADPSDRQGQVWVYDILHPERPPKRRAPKGCCFVKDLYRLEVLSDPMELEAVAFKGIEDEVAPIFKRFAGPNPDFQTFTPKESAYLRAYMTSLLIRNPGYLKVRAESAHQELSTKLAQGINQILPGIPLPYEPLALLEPSEISLWPHLLANDGYDLASFIDGLQLRVFTLEDGEPQYFLPDFPVAAWADDGLGTCFAMPISPWSIVLLGKDIESTINSWCELRAAGAYQVLLRYADRFCYASENSQRLRELCRNRTVGGHQ